MNNQNYKNNNTAEQPCVAPNASARTASQYSEKVITSAENRAKLARILALTGMLFGIVGVAVCFRSVSGVFGALGFILGIVSLIVGKTSVKHCPDTDRCKGKAVGSIILGIISVIASIAFAAASVLYTYILLIA